MRAWLRRVLGCPPDPFVEVDFDAFTRALIRMFEGDPNWREEHRDA